MAKQVSISFKGIELPEAYVRINRVFGGKKEGWNAVVGVYKDAEAAKEMTNTLDVYNVTAEYSTDEMNPFTLLYAAIADKYETSIDV